MSCHNIVDSYVAFVSRCFWLTRWSLRLMSWSWMWCDCLKLTWQTSGHAQHQARKPFSEYFFLASLLIMPLFCRTTRALELSRTVGFACDYVRGASPRMLLQQQAALAGTGPFTRLHIFCASRIKPLLLTVVPPKPAWAINNNHQVGQKA